MRYRECDIPAELDISTDVIPERNTEKWQTETYKLKVITPIYGGGVKAGEPDAEMPIRAAEIRGQLRYWWRFLYINDPARKEEEKNESFYKILFKKEREIWGGMADTKELEEALKQGKDFSSKVFVRIYDINDLQDSIRCCEYKQKVIDGIPQTDRNGHPIYGQPIFKRINDIELPQYALFSAQGKPPGPRDYNPATDKPHKIIKPDFTFSMQITFKNPEKENWKSIQDTIRWWACFGGLGARTRRGLGSVEVIKVLNKMDREVVFEYLSADDVSEYGCKLEMLDAKTSMDAWSFAIKLLHDFRQGVGAGRNQKNDQQGNPIYHGKNKAQGGSRWSEPDSIREILGTYSKLKKTRDGKEKVICNEHKPSHPARIAFPRAAFGLPIIFKFNNDKKCGDPKQSELRPINSQHMSSPLILKALKTEKAYKAMALKLPFEKSNLILELKGYANKPDNLKDEKLKEWEKNNWEQWSNKWWDSSKAAQVDPINDNIGENNATDALSAFMNFFAKGGNN